MKIVYVAGPFRAPTMHGILNNIRAAEESGLAVVRAGAIPLIPHSMTQWFHGIESDNYWLEATLEYLRRCDAVLMMPMWRKSVGATAEHDEARRIGLPVFYDPSGIPSWLRHPRVEAR